MTFADELIVLSYFVWLTPFISEMFLSLPKQLAESISYYLASKMPLNDQRPD